MSNAKATDNNKNDDTKHEHNKESDAEEDESASLVQTTTTKAKEVAGFMLDKMADGMAFAAEKIKEARK